MAKPRRQYDRKKKMIRPKRRKPWKEGYARVFFIPRYAHEVPTSNWHTGERKAVLYGENLKGLRGAFEIRYGYPLQFSNEELYEALKIIGRRNKEDKEKHEHWRMRVLDELKLMDVEELSEKAERYAAE